jgi:hypothetical protein
MKLVLKWNGKNLKTSFEAKIKKNKRKKNEESPSNMNH